MAPRLEDVRCDDIACAHRLGDHGVNGYCYGLVRRPTGTFVNCVCRKFRMPGGARLQTPPQNT